MLPVSTTRPAPVTPWTAHRTVRRPRHEHPTVHRFPATATLAVQPQPTLFSAYTLGDIALDNRIVLSPMTRSRALDGNVANPLAATYYVQRASAGLMITEGTQVSPQGVGYIRTPGIHSPEQVAGWKRVTDAVHRVGGTIFAQLWHVGRVSHPDFHGGALPVAPSALPVDGEAFTSNGKVKIPTPRALEASEIRGIIAQFRKGAENAKAAGFDGVELHGANGYLLDQFLRDGSNQRTDAYGGSICQAHAACRSKSPKPSPRSSERIASATSSRPTSPMLLDVGLQSDRDLQPPSRRSSASSGSAICTCRKRSPGR